MPPRFASEEPRTPQTLGIWERFYQGECRWMCLFVATVLPIVYWSSVLSAGAVSWANCQCLDIVELWAPEPLPPKPPHEELQQQQQLVQEFLRHVSCGDQLRPRHQLPHNFRWSSHDDAVFMSSLTFALHKLPGYWATLDDRRMNMSSVTLTAGLGPNCEECVNKTTWNTVVAPPDLDDFSATKRIHESRICVTDVFAIVPLLSQTCWRPPCHQRELHNLDVAFRETFRSTCWRFSDVAEEMLKSLVHVPKHVDGAAHWWYPELAACYDEWPSWSLQRDCRQMHWVHRDRLCAFTSPLHTSSLSRSNWVAAAIFVLSVRLHGEEEVAFGSLRQCWKLVLPQTSPPRSSVQ